MTKSNAVIEKVLQGSEKFASAQEIYTKVNSKKKTMGLTTVYRALTSLSEQNIVDVVYAENGEATYRICVPEHHHHLICNKCRKIVEIDDGPVDEWVNKVAKKAGFSDVTHQIEIRGLCKTCK